MNDMTRPRRVGAWLRKRGPLLAGELLLFTVIILAAEWFMTRDAVRGPAPVFAAPTVTGEAFNLHQLRGEPSLIYFWATWCPVCKAGKGTIDALAKDHPVITIAMQSGEAEAVRQYLHEEAVTFPAIADATGEIARHYGVNGVPALFVLDSRGDVAFVARGYTTSLGLRLRLFLADVFRF